MPTYNIKTLQKKNVWETETWQDAETNRWFDKVEMYRWGEVVIYTDEPLDIEEASKNENGFWITLYEIEDQSFDDGCALYFKEFVDVDEEYVDTLWNEDGYMALEDDGFEMTDVETVFYGPLEVKEINEETD